MPKNRDPEPTTSATASSISRSAFFLTLGLGLLIVLAAGLPGHMTTDSFVQLAEGRAGAQRSFNPAFMSWLMGRFDSVLSGTALFVAFNVGLLFGALALLPRLSGRVNALAAPVLALVILTPQVLIYQGAVWKDVFFANAAIAGTVLLAVSVQQGLARGGGRIAWAAGALLLVIAALVRQNGVLALGAAGLAIGLAIGSRQGWRRGLAASGGLIGASLILFFAITLVMSQVMPSSQTGGAGLRIIQHFDLVGVIARDSQASLGPLEAEAPRAAATLRAEAAIGYNPQRVDAVGKAPGLGEALWQTPEGLVGRTWAHVIREDFGDYAAHRLAVFREALLTPDILACLPVSTGTEGPDDILAELGMTFRQDRQDRELYNYASWFFGTPVLSHLTFALISLAVMVALTLRGRPSDWMLAGLQAGALAFAGSFLVIGLACDYRYLYFLDLAALFGLVHLALDPPWMAIIRRFQK